MYRFKTLGGVVLERESGPISGRSSLRRRLALLALLASARDRGVPRDKLVAYLWPERDAEHGRHSLSQLLHALRRELGADAITIGVDDLRLNSSAIWTDIGAFTEAMDDGRLEDAVAQQRRDLEILREFRVRTGKRMNNAEFGRALGISKAEAGTRRQAVADKEAA